MNTKITKVCPDCGSTDVSRDATARWDEEAQAWEISGLHDGFYCDACDSELKDLEDQVLEE